MPRRAGFIVDLHRCTGCSACVVACRLENESRSAVPWRRVVPMNEARYPGGPTWFLSVACHHCEQPACARSCPSGAYEQRADGIVVHHDERCLGCRYCEMACPFGAPTFDETRRVVTKCDFCRSRTDAGERPACVAACPMGALAVLDGNDRTASRAVSRFGIRDWEDAGRRHEERSHARIAAVRPVAAVPGFSDAAGCRPSVRFKLPRGMRGKRLKGLLNG